MESPYFLWSIVSTIFGVIFLIANVAQFVSNKKEKEIHKSQVKIWQHHANGIANGLFIATQEGRHSSVNDLQQTIKTIQPVAHSLYTSLNEERLFSEKEIKEKQLTKEKENAEFLKLVRGQSSEIKSSKN